MTTTTWTIQPGTTVIRRRLHDAYGGRRYNGIATSSQTPNIMLFTGEQGADVYPFDHEYPDGSWDYTGEGRLGDQELRQGNKAILNHVDDGRALRLFRILAGGKAEYVGEFTLASVRQADAPDEEGAIRSVYVFHLVPVGGGGPGLAGLPQVEEVDVEASEAARYSVETEVGGDSERVRREAALVDAYRRHLRRHGVEATRHRIRMEGDASFLYTDLYIGGTKTLVEAKPNTSRAAFRMAIGQLFDYARYLDQPNLAILVPSRPRPDLLRLAAELGIGVIYQEGDSFQTM